MTPLLKNTRARVDDAERAAEFVETLIAYITNGRGCGYPTPVTQERDPTAGASPYRKTTGGSFRLMLW